ncbi:sporulation protein [Altererythrobacter salegens]|uniref:Sporulation protein n=1 Tax=Croceibacterium salegens TaxID=1737568 RepID=A0A6I4T052_9SPHN|nr:SPOR domain-containing protein [Croceibacterium salegens]MXO60978.1 sporulation protein [Croceibacterium salegens]
MIAKVDRLKWAGFAAVALLAASPALADVKAGVDAWSRGDYGAAVREWEGPAAAGDPDAMFNLGQAYRLGRGVPVDARKAEVLYARAAAAGHIKAADTYGLMLFQDGRRDAALPYIESAASRGDPRSEYLLGIGHFNGDIVPKDWVKAYALMTMANAQGLPQAPAALAQMDESIPLAQRQQAAGLAVQMQRDTEIERGRALASADLGAGVVTPASRIPMPAQGAPPVASSKLPRTIATTAVSPSVVVAREAVAQATQATGTESPAEAGASFARPGATAAPRTQVAATTATRPEPSSATTRPSTGNSSAGPWRVQLGAFSVVGNAERLWSQLSGRSELAGRQRLLIPAGQVTKLLAGGYATQADANAACRSLKSSGQDCLVTR